MQRILLLVVVVTLWISPIGAQENKAAGPKPARVEVTSRVTEVEAGQQLKFSAIGYDEAGNKLDATPSAWYATPFDLAYADEQGAVTFVQPGEVRIGALINGRSGFVSISVKPQAVARIEIKAPSTPIPVGTGVLVSMGSRLSPMRSVLPVSVNEIR